MIARIKLRRGTSAAATAANPILAAGEAGYETDTGRLKIGDGTTAWNSLGYFTGGGAVGAHAAQHGADGTDPLTPAAIGAEAAGAAAEVGAALLLHAGDTGNPHGVTLEQVGAQAAMTAASQAEMEAGTEAGLRSLSPLLVAQAIEALGGGGGGAVLQVVTVVDSTSYAIYNAVIPCDGTIPQISEGTDYPELAVTITPKSAASKIVLRYSLNVGAQTSSNNIVVYAVFRDADGDAVYATHHFVYANMPKHIAWDVVLAAGGTAQRTYYLRTGQHVASKYHYINRTPGVDNHFGGVEGGSVVAMEVAG